MLKVLSEQKLVLHLQMETEVTFLGKVIYPELSPANAPSPRLSTHPPIHTHLICKDIMTFLGQIPYGNFFHAMLRCVFGLLF